jgi:uncharacterized repeat protein (TIGR03847 family)
MARQVFVYDSPERFVAGTVGAPGERTFYLQARGEGRLTSVALEKEQVSLLAQRIEQLLDEVVRVTGGSAAVPAASPAELDDLEPLDQPVLDDFRVGTMALAWDGESERVVIEAQAVTDDAEEQAAITEDDAAEGPDLLRVRLTGVQARAFAKRALAVVAAGRPPCPFCGLPLDPAGHICPRQNGYRR